MKPSNRRMLSGSCLVQAMVLASVLPWASDLPGQTQEKKEGSGSAPKKSAAPTPGAVEVRLADDSVIKVILRDERLELDTAYGKLSIPVADVQRIEFGLRLSDDVTKRIKTALADLGSADFRRRKAATDDLLALKEKAYPYLVQAGKGKEPETIRRIDEIMEKIREEVAAELLETPLFDVVHTADSKIAGRIKGDSLRVGTLAFGDQQVKMGDIRSLRSQSLRESEPAVAEGVLVDPNALRMYANQVGKTLTFKLTGPPAGLFQGGVYGTDVYTLDSSLEGAAIHAGVLQPGKSATFRVTIVGQHPAFQPSVRNGIASHAYGPWPAFRIEKPKLPKN